MDAGSPEYRGSTGYGRGVYENIDYGGLETEDNHACRAYMIENYDFIDAGRVGMIGWSHGGLIGLMNAFAHPDDYQCVYAGVPVSDLIARLGYLDDDYRALYSDREHRGIQAALTGVERGKIADAAADPHQYQRRRPKTRSSNTKFSKTCPADTASTGSTASRPRKSV